MVDPDGSSSGMEGRSGLSLRCVACLASLCCVIVHLVEFAASRATVNCGLDQCSSPDSRVAVRFALPTDSRSNRTRTSRPVSTLCRTRVVRGECPQTSQAPAATSGFPHSPHFRTSPPNFNSHGQLLNRRGTRATRASNGNPIARTQCDRFIHRCSIQQGSVDRAGNRYKTPPSRTVRA